MAAVRRVAARQRMLIATRQLEALGVSESGRRGAVRQGDLVHRQRGVYGLAGAGHGWEDRVMVAVLGSGCDTVASFDTARRLWLPGDRPESDAGAIEVTGSRRVRVRGVASHRQALPATEVTRRSGIPVTTVSRTLIDLATRLDRDHLGVLVDEALRRRVVTLRELQRVAGALFYADGRARQGGGPLRVAAEDRRSGPGANAWEERMDREWDRMGLPPALRQHWIETPYGWYCVDRAIVELRIAVEWNGYEYHGRRSRFDRDSDRRGHLLEAGWLVLDFTSQSSAAHIRRTVLAAVAQRRSQLGLAG